MIALLGIVGVMIFMIVVLAIIELSGGGVAQPRSGRPNQ